MCAVIVPGRITTVVHVFAVRRVVQATLGHVVGVVVTCIVIVTCIVVTCIVIVTCIVVVT